MNMDVSKMYQMEYKDGGIHINPENRGKFNATKARTGKTTEELTHSLNPLTRKRAIFAQNAAKWNHEDGGLLKAQSGLIVPRDYASDVYAGDLTFSGGPAYSNNKLLNLATIENPNQINPMLANSNDTQTQDITSYGYKPVSQVNTLSNKSNVNTNVNSTSLGTSNHQAFNPRKLTTYGDRIAENALNRTTAYNLARSLEPARKEPLIMPEFKFKKQFAQADFNPVYEMQNLALRNYANNSRSTAALMGNLQQLNANMVKAKSKIAGDAQTQQRAYDATFAGQQQDWENKLALTRQNVEDKNTAHEAEKFNFLSDTMTNWEKADQQRAKLYNTNLQNWNEMNTYINSLSNEYTAVRDPKEGTVKIVFKSNGKEVPNEELEKKKAEYEARKNGNTTVTNPNTSFTKPSFKMNYQFGNKKLGGAINQVTVAQNKIKKLRTGLY